MNTAAITIRGLYKSFSGIPVVNNISLDIPQGSFYGIVGPNGAGKTTTLSMVTGMLRPDNGQVFIENTPVWPDSKAIKNKIGVLADGMRTFDRLNGLQLLQYSGYLRGLDKETTKTRALDLLNLCGLEDASNKAVADYSAGMTKKIGLACALIHAPKVIILDEPFEAVDPVSAANIRGVLQSIVAAGGTVVVSSHVMQMVENMCSHVAIINHGQIMLAGSVAEATANSSLEEQFINIVGGRKDNEGPAWLHNF